MFTKDYWLSSANKLKQTRYLALIATMIAMKVVVSWLYVPVGESLRIYLTFLIVSIEAAIIGPVAAMVSGGITDIVSFMIHPTGPFFFGYTISSICGGLIYALFFYQRRISIPRIAGAKFCVNYLINVLMGSLWSAMMYSKGYIFYATQSVIKNTLMLPIEIVLLYIVFKMILPYLEKRNLVVSQSKLQQSSNTDGVI